MAMVKMIRLAAKSVKKFRRAEKTRKAKADRDAEREAAKEKRKLECLQAQSQDSETDGENFPWKWALEDFLSPSSPSLPDAELSEDEGLPREIPVATYNPEPTSSHTVQSVLRLVHNDLDNVELYDILGFDTDFLDTESVCSDKPTTQQVNRMRNLPPWDDVTAAYTDRQEHLIWGRREGKTEQDRADAEKALGVLDWAFKTFFHSRQLREQAQQKELREGEGGSQEESAQPAQAEESEDSEAVDGM